MKIRGRGSSLSIDVGTISLGRLLAFGLSLIIPLVLTRALSVEEYGVYRELSLLIITIQPILLFGIPSSLRYFIPRSNEFEKRQYITQTFIFSVIVGFALFIFLALAGGWLTQALFHENFNEYMLVLGAHGFLLITASYIGVVMIINDDVNLASLTAIVFSILDVFILCGGVIISRTVMGLLVAVAIASLIKFIIAVLYISKHYKPSVTYISYPSFKKQWTFSAPIGLSVIINLLNVNIDKFYIAFFFTQETFGIYSIGALITPMILVIYRAVFDIIVPEFSKLYKQKKLSTMIRLWHEGVRKMALLFYPLFIFLFIFANDLIAILFPDAYSGSVPVFRLYLFLLPLTINLFNGVLLAAGETKFLLKATSIAFAINLVLNWLLIIWFMEMGIGILGPPTATVLINILLHSLLLYQIYVIMKRPISELFPWKLLGTFLGISLIAGFISIFIMLLLGFEPLGGLIALPSGYSGLIQMFDSIPEIVIRIISFALGFVAFFLIYYSIARKMGLIIKEDVDTVMRFLHLKR
ncbi:MAG: oligosaccharide flippase family protein [Thermoplasmata archaeon]|nr:MAG: oligosaccharide flippase family protein [Thermoplasmata archaeon]